jgi:hypothetical protein
MDEEASHPTPPSPAPRGIVMGFLNLSMNSPAFITVETIHLLGSQIQ